MSGGANSMVQKGVEIVSLAIKADGEKNYELAFAKYAPPPRVPLVFRGTLPP